MAGKRLTSEEIVARLRQVEVLSSQGKTVAEAVRAIGVTEVTYYRWRKEYGGLKGDHPSTQPCHFRAFRGMARGHEEHMTTTFNLLLKMTDQTPCCVVLKNRNDQSNEVPSPSPQFRAQGIYAIAEGLNCVDDRK